MLNLLPGKKSHKGKLLGILFVLLLIITSSLTPYIIRSAFGQETGTFQSASLTISDSRASGGDFGTNVTYDFSMKPTATTAIKQIDIEFCTTSTGACTAPPGMDVGANPTLAAETIPGSDNTVTNPTDNNTITVVVGTTGAADPDTAITMQFTGITNTTDNNSTFFARVTSYSDTGTTIIDTVQVGQAVLDTTSIYVSADVTSTFTFSVTAATSGNVLGEAITVTDSTDTTIPFGVLVRATPKLAAHDVTVVTNANTGYTVTVRSDEDPPLADGDNDIDKFDSGNDDPAVWSAPDGAKNTDSGFFGYTTNDATLGTGTANRFTSGGPKFAGPNPTPYEVAYSNIAVVTPAVTRLGWKAEINGNQPPGSYTGYIVLVATPLY